MSSHSGTIMKYFQENEKDAFKVLFESLYPVMVLFARKILYNIENAEDIAQEAFVELWQQRSKFESFNHIKAFLYLSIKNKCLNNIKHKMVVEKFRNDPDANNDDIEEQIIEAEVINHLYNAINSLPEQQKQTIILSMQGLTNEEIAQQLHISVNTVKHHKKAAYKLIRSKINPSLYLVLVF